MLVERFFNKVLFAVLGLLLLVSSASALSLYSSADHMSLRGVDGKMYFWITNTDGEAKSVALTASVGNLNGFFEDAGFVLPSTGTKGTYLHLSAPKCFNGVEKVEVKAEVCDLNGFCQVLRKDVLVSFSPSSDASCSKFQSHYVSAPDFYDYPVRYGDGSIASSTLSYDSYADGSFYAVDLLGPSSCVNVKPGDSAVEYFTVVNRGAASSFDIVAVNRNDVNAIVSIDSVTLYRNELEDLKVELAPNRGLAGGYYYVPLQVIRNGVVVAEKNLCVNVQETVDARVVVPSLVEGKSCQAISIDGIVYNEGTAQDAYSITAALPSGKLVTAQPNDFAVRGGDSASFKIFIEPGSLNEGENYVSVTAKSSLKNIVGQARILVNAKSCAGGILTVDTTQTQDNNVINVLVSIKNDDDVDLKAVSATIENLPPSWTVESGVIDVPAHTTRELGVKVKANSNEQADNAVLVLKSGANEIARKPLGTVKAPSSTTGLFTALSENSLWILLLILLALLVAVFAARGGFTSTTTTTTVVSEDDGFRNRVLDKLAKMKREAAK